MSDSDSSSSDAEELARCREAARPAWGLEQRLPGAGTTGGGRRLCWGRLGDGRVWVRDTGVRKGLPGGRGAEGRVQGGRGLD